MCTICKTQGVYVGKDVKMNFVGFMAQEYLCKELGYSIEEILDMPTVSEVSAQAEDQSPRLIDINSIFEKEHIAPTKMAVGSPYILKFDDNEIWELY